MNSVIKDLLNNGEPKITSLSEDERAHYVFGLKLLGTVVCENFFDLGKLPKDRFDHDGLFYTIPYFDDEQLWSMDNKRCLLVVYKVENRSSFCPMSLDVQTLDENNFRLIVNDQSGPRTIRRALVARERGRYFTEIDGYDRLTLSQLLHVEAESHDRLTNRS